MLLAPHRHLHGRLRNTVRDAAIVRLDGGTKWLAEITEIGVVADPHAHGRRGGAAELPGAQARHAYRADRRDRRGAEHPEHVDGNTRNNVIVVKPNPNAGVKAGGTLFFSDHGDSGSAVVNANNEIVALHFAGSTVGLIHKGLELPIADILAQFQTVDGLTLAVATATARERSTRCRAPRPSAPQPVLAPAFAAALPSPSRPGRRRAGSAGPGGRPTAP